MFKEGVSVGLGVGLALLASSAVAGQFDQYVMPVSNPVYDGDARNVTMVRPIYLRQNLPDKVDTIVGKVPVGGYVNGFALQASYAINERMSIVAVKDGYVDCNPDHTLNDHNGWADIAAGLQYSFLYMPEQDFILTGRLVYESTTGSDQVFQGNGDGNINPSILFLKGFNGFQFSGALGLVLPVDNDEENTLFYDSWHVSYAVTPWFHPLVELNHFHVLSAGDRNVPNAGLGAIGTHQEDDLVAGIAKFNGCDIINLGGKHSDDNRDMVTMALGARFKVNQWVDLGAVYEFPLTDDSKGLLQDRLMVDAMFTLRF